MKVSNVPFIGPRLSWLDRVQPNPTLALSLTASVVGLFSGAGVWLFKQLIEWAHGFFFGTAGAALAGLGPWTVALLPVMGGLIVGLITHFFVGVERHHGVAGIMEAVALAGSRLRYRRIPAKAIAAALSIGSGASVGPEDPSVQIGSNIGSMVGQRLRLSDERMRALVAGGAAAGVAAAFNAPIAGVFFALEVVLGEISGNALGIVVLASVVSAALTQAIAGPQPAFQVPAYAFQGPEDLPFYVLLGLLAGPVAALYVRCLYYAQDIFHSIALPRWTKPAVAGLIVGAVGIFLPQVFGVGYETIEAILAGEQLAVGLLLVLVAAKLALTAICIGGGFMGGVFAPSLFLGAALGAAVASIAGLVFPGLPVPAFAMVGMAAVLAGAVHAPLTAILLLFEMTNDYRIILPLMLAVVVSLFISQHLQSDSVYTLGLTRKGIRLERGRDVDVLQAITVGEVMHRDHPTLREGDTLSAAYELLMETRRHGLPVLDGQDRLVGILTVEDIDAARHRDRLDATVGDICTRELLLAYPDETIGEVLRRTSTRDVGRLPVVSRDDPRKLLGLLRRSDVIRAYNIALTRRAALRHRVQQVRLGAVSGEEVSVTELLVEQGAPCSGKKVSEIPWPEDCILASLRRGQKFLIPHGDTVIQPGDVLVAVAEGDARHELTALCKSPGAQG